MPRSIGIRPDQYRVGDANDLRDRQAGKRRMPADRLRARRLVDADTAERAFALRKDVTADPADVVRHPIARFRERAGRGVLKLGLRAPTLAAENCIEPHVCSFPLTKLTVGRPEQARLREDCLFLAGRAAKPAAASATLGA